jgi:hypothetical protein
MRREDAFRNRIVPKMEARGIMVQRIESNLTGSGIPDLYCVHKTPHVRWVELKAVNTRMPQDVVGVPWRAAQKAWATELYVHSNKKDTVYTFCDFIDCLLVVRMDRVFNRYGDVYIEKDRCYAYYGEGADEKMLSDWLTMSYPFKGDDE